MTKQQQKNQAKADGEAKAIAALMETEEPEVPVGIDAKSEMTYKVGTDDKTKTLYETAVPVVEAQASARTTADEEELLVDYYIQPLPAATSSTSVDIRGIPGAYARAGPPAFARGERTAQNTRGGDLQEGVSNTTTAAATRESSLSNHSGLVSAREVSELEELNVSGMAQAEPMGDASTRSVSQGTLRNAKQRQTTFLFALAMLLILMAISVTLAVTLLRDSDKNEAAATANDGNSSIASAQLWASDEEQFLWDNLPLVTQQAILPNGNLTDPQTSIPQRLAFDWLVQDPVFSSIYNRNGSTMTRIHQRFALATLYYATKGHSWHSKDGWLDHGNHECDWWADDEMRMGGPPVLQESPCGTLDGIEDDGVFRRLWLPNNNLDGPWPAQEIYGMLTNLESINLFGNGNLTGPAMMPSMGTECPNLMALSFVMCGTSGTIPSELGLLTDMEVMYYNKLQKPMNSTTSDSYLTGFIPSEIGRLSLLKHLAVSNNFMTGSLPTELGLLAELELFQVNGNIMNGRIPSTIGDTK